MLYFSRQYDRAIEQFRAVLAVDPKFWTSPHVDFCLRAKGAVRGGLGGNREMEEKRRQFLDSVLANIRLCPFGA